MLLSIILAVPVIFGGLANALSSTLKEVTAFTSGPTGAGMYIYAPTSLTSSTKAPIIVAIHYCGGSANGYFTNSQYATLADTHGFLVIFPDAPNTGNRWDVSSIESLTHDGGGDSKTIVNMVQHAVDNYGGNADEVYVTGSSSGAIMTNILAGAYPNVFKAASIYSGVPDGCFYVAGATAGMDVVGWNSTCSTGLSVDTAEGWGSTVRSYFPNYTGSYPKMQIFHGTSDTTLAYANLAEELKEWSNLLGVSFSSNATDTPSSGYTKMVYGDGTELVGYSALGVGHTVPIHEDLDLKWFGIA